MRSTTASPPIPFSLPACAVLKSKAEYKRAMRMTRSLGLPLHPDHPKNWDSIGALSVFLSHCGNRSGRMLDAGGGPYSVILWQLYCFHYTSLTCINLEFKTKTTAKGIAFEPGDLTGTRFSNNYFTGISCLSVIEHGIDIEVYFREMSRILIPGGILFTSADYWDEPIDPGTRLSYGAPVKIFTPGDILSCIRTAAGYGLQPIGELDLICRNRVVECLGLKYTFIYFALRKME